jgi:uncharacterized protein DUF3300
MSKSTEVTHRKITARLKFAAVLVTATVMGLSAVPAPAQGPLSFGPGELDRLVSRVALYPDPLLAQVLAAATFSDQIPDAAPWADEHHYLRGEDLAGAIAGDRLPWDPSVQALLPFPSVLDMMASDMNWTRDLGDAFLAERDAVMDAVQRMRRQAWNYGYLRSNPQVVVRDGPFIEIVPANPAFVIVPAYDPVVVYAPPRPGIFVGWVIHFGFGVNLCAAFRPWGWGYNRFNWDRHVVVVNDAPWGRTWVNRPTYVFRTRHRATPRSAAWKNMNCTSAASVNGRPPGRAGSASKSTAVAAGTAAGK